MFKFNASPFIQSWESASVHLNWLFPKVTGKVIVFSLSKDAAFSLICVYCAYAKKEQIRLFFCSWPEEVVYVCKIRFWWHLERNMLCISARSKSKFTLACPHFRIVSWTKSTKSSNSAETGGIEHWVLVLAWEFLVTDECG